MFDNLIGNRDRNRGNMLRDRAWNLILLDHSRALRRRHRAPHKMNRIDEGFWAKIEGLTRKSARSRRSAQWLDENQIKAILDRREKMRAEIKSLPK